MNDDVISKKNVIILFISALLIVIFHNLNLDFYFKNITFPFLILVLSYTYILSSNKNINRKAYYLLIPIFLILISNLVISIDLTNMILNVVILPILITTFLMALVNKNFNISNDYLLWIFKLFPDGLLHNLKFLEMRNKDGEKSRITNIILGTIIGLCLGFIILNLLMSADDYFQQFIDNIIGCFNFDFSNVVLLIGAFIVLFSIFVNVLKNKNTKMKELNIRKIDELTVTIVLGIINVIFVLFLISEISRLTVNFLQLPVRYTYSSYAREGFFQLLFVTVINFSIIIYLLYRSQIVTNSSKVKRLILVLIFFSIILIFNSYYRMFLYIGNYGFTPLRLQVILFLAMELVTFGVIIKKIMKGLKRDALIYFIIMISFYIINVYLCNNTIINL